MKTFAIRAFVLTLALAGASATAISHAATTKHELGITPHGEAPAPLCTPASGDNCGME